MSKLEVMKQAVNELLQQHCLDAAVHIETDEGILSVNSHQVFSSASLIKVPILLTALREVEKGRLHLEEEVKGGLSVGGAGVLSALSPNPSFTWKDILTLMMIVSDNSATNWIIDRLEMDTINRLIKSLNLEQTCLNRKMMDFQAIERGVNNLTNAYDMVQLLRVMKDKGRWIKDSYMLMESIMAKQQFTLLTAELEEESHPNISYGSKSGSLQGVQHDCAYFCHESKYVLAAVLTANLPNQMIGKQLISEIGMAIKRYII
ncbi:serine hydrolase [Cytobacillus sp. FSL K6-0129]|uniref:serine hydrolase n=1 Tax=Cytobacillus sp. FSL K6-0129 TaxID=2921421 RepID=UPI0030F76135